MRLRFAVLGSVLTALVVAALPGTSVAAPRHNRGLTINATPNPIIAGEGVLIYGQLNAAPVMGQKIVLYHHVAGSQQGYTRIGETTTDAHGFYEFTRAEGVVETNRSWFAREAGGQNVHSRTVYERVSALVSLSASATNADTNHAILFYGHVDPNHRFERVYLQAQKGGSDDWTTLKSTRLGPLSNYTIWYRWRVPGVRDVRVVFRGDFRNIRGESDPVTVTIQQAQIPGFTIASSSPIIPEGSTVSISGVLDQPGTTTPEPNTSVTLWGRVHGQSAFSAIESRLTGNNGSYSFLEKPVQNTEYIVRTTFKPHRHSAVLFQGVRDVLTLSASSMNVLAGQPVLFIGAVTPDKAGDVVYLQRLGADGEWHTVAVNTVRADSTFQFVRTFGTAGSKTFRARIPGDPTNVGGASAPVTVNVTLPPVAALPPAS